MANNMEGTQFRMYQAMTNDYKAFGKQVYTVTTTAGKLTVPPSCKYALIQIESTVTDGKAIRFWVDGSTPTSSAGFFRGNGDVFDLTDAENINNFLVIQGTSGTTTLIVQYFR